MWDFRFLNFFCFKIVFIVVFKYVDYVKVINFLGLNFGKWFKGWLVFIIFLLER